MKKLDKLLIRNKFITNGIIIVLISLSLLFASLLKSFDNFLLIITIFSLMITAKFMNVWFSILKEVYFAVEYRKLDTSNKIAQWCNISKCTAKKALMYLNKKEFINSPIEV